MTEKVKEGVLAALSSGADITDEAIATFVALARETDPLDLDVAMHSVVWEPSSRGEWPEASRALRFAARAVLDLRGPVAGMTEKPQEATMVVYLIDDVLEARPFPDCVGAFDAVCAAIAPVSLRLYENLKVNGRSKLLSGPFNRLLRRVRGVDDAFAGRVVCFLTSLCPAEVEQKQIASSDGSAPFHAKPSQPTSALDAVELKSYDALWGVVSCTRNAASMAQCLSHPDKWRHFQEHFATLHDALRNASDATFQASAGAGAGAVSADEFCPRYLADERLLWWQLHDPLFARQVLTQVAMAANSAQRAVRPMRDGQPQTPLATEAQLTALKEIERKALELTEKISPQGRRFTEAVSSLLKEDVDVAALRKEKKAARAAMLQSVKLARSSSPPAVAVAASAPVATTTPQTSTPTVAMPTMKVNESLMALCAQTSEQVKVVDDMFTSPSMEQFREAAQNSIEDSVYRWRLMRLASQCNLDEFAKLQEEYIPPLQSSTTTAAATAAAAAASAKIAVRPSSPTEDDGLPPGASAAVEEGEVAESTPDARRGKRKRDEDDETPK